ncbi:MAG TPA: NUDIX domain-containing protein [Patescibacteria group bacterium]
MTRFPFLVAVHLVLFKDTQVLLLRRYNTGYMDGSYSVPAGHVDGGEAIKTAMIREAQEEVGIIIQEEDLEPYVMHRIISPSEERIDFFFKCTTWSGIITNCEAEKCDELRWCDVDSLPNNVIPYVRFGLEQVMRGEFLTVFNEKTNVSS